MPLGETCGHVMFTELLNEGHDIMSQYPMLINVDQYQSKTAFAYWEKFAQSPTKSYPDQIQC